jgi:type-F conjugative transfer system pilin assembly protein TrbC
MMNYVTRICLTLMLLAGSVHAQTQAERAKMIQDAARAQDTNGQRKALIDQAAKQAQPAKVQIPDSAPSKVKIDPEKIARQYSEIRGPEKQEKESNEVMVFVSTSMPKGSLEKAGRDSRITASMVVMRGASKGVGPGKWIASVEAMKPLTDNGGEVFLHPDLFVRYGITKVPAVVVAPEAQAGCDEDACREFAVVYGDVSLAYALERLADRKDTIGSIARARLQKLNQ